MSQQQVKATELQPDERNANAGTERGLAMLESSLRRYGAGRSILLDRKGRVIAGNKTLASAVDLGFEDVLLVQTDGTKLVAVQRTDLDLEDDSRARELAYADNRVAEVDLEWDTALLAEDRARSVKLERFWSKKELEKLVVDEDASALRAVISGGETLAYTVTVTCEQGTDQLAELIEFLDSRGYSYSTKE